MSSPASQVRHRGAHKEKKQANGKVDNTQDVLDEIVESSKRAVKSEWDYKLALAVIVALSFLTRFWGISHPNQVVFDEVHFGKVWLWDG